MEYMLQESSCDERDIIYGNVFGLSKDRPRKFMLDITEIRNQSSLNTCAGFSSCAILECYFSAILNKPMTHLSPLWAFSNANPRKTGTTYREMLDGIKKNGVCEETLYPYIVNAETKDNIFPKKSSDATSDAKKYIPSGYARLTSLEEIKDAIYRKYGVMLGLKVYGNYTNTYKGFVRKPVPKSTPIGGHAIATVGYDDDIEITIDGEKYKGALILKESYGVGRGVNGLLYMPYDFMKWTGLYSMDKVFQEAWCFALPSDVKNIDYHINGEGKGIEIPVKKIVMTVGNINATVDGESVLMQSAPKIVGSSTFVPISFISKAFGGATYWDNQEKRVTIDDSVEKINVTFRIGSGTANVNDKTYYMVQPAFIDENGRTQVPIRMIGETLGCFVDYDTKTKTITITR